MPRIELTKQHVNLLIPLIAVNACYSCQRMLMTDSEKYNCYCCYVGFCSKCTENKYLLREYGFTKPQRVCTVCHVLLTRFPRILSEVSSGHGGQLLMPNVRVWITDAKAFDDVTVAPHPRDRSAAPGLVPAPPSGLDAAVLAAAVNACAKGGKAALPPAQGLTLSLLAFRPVNVDTVIALGDAARVPVRCICGIERDGARVRLVFPNGYIDLTVATVEGLEEEEDELQTPHRDTGDVSGLSTPGSTPEPTSYYGGDPSALPMEDTPSNGSGQRDERPRSPYAAGGGGSQEKKTGSGTADGSPRAGQSPAVQPVAQQPKRSVLAWLSSVFSRSSAKAEDEITVTVDAESAMSLETGLRDFTRRLKSHAHLRPISAAMDASAADMAAKLRRSS